MAVTLQTLINESADYIKVDLTDADDATVIENRITSALNEAKNLVAHRMRLTTSESVTLDANACFNTASLTKTFWGLVTVQCNDGYIYVEERNGLVWCNTAPSSTVTVEYQYIPADMTAKTDVYPLPASVSWRLLCYYAAARYYEIKGTTSAFNKYRYWMNEWEDGLNSLKGGSKKARRRVKATYNYGDC